METLEEQILDRVAVWNGDSRGMDSGLGCRMEWRLERNPSTAHGNMFEIPSEDWP